MSLGPKQNKAKLRLKINMKINFEDKKNRIRIIDLELIQINTDNTNSYGTKVSVI